MPDNHSLEQRLQQVVERVRAAEARFGRAPGSVRNDVDGIQSASLAGGVRASATFPGALVPTQR